MDGVGGDLAGPQILSFGRPAGTPPDKRMILLSLEQRAEAKEDGRWVDHRLCSHFDKGARVDGVSGGTLLRVRCHCSTLKTVT